MKLEIADLFCGAGGTSTGAVEAAEMLGYQPHLTAINHWPVAIATHERNHPGSRHLCTSIDEVNPRLLFLENELDILWASPECTHHSIARGGKPINEQSRATAHCVPRWAEAVRPAIIFVENVKEFTTWGPLLPKKVRKKGKWVTEWHPDPKRKGEIFKAWVEMVKACGYSVEWRVICAADYGDPTTRERLIVQAVRGRRKCVWPTPTHGPNAALPWTTAADEVIDWALQGKSIFTRKRGLVVKSIRRILTGLERFALAPFLHEHPRTKGAGIRPTSVPISTITASSSDFALTPAFVVEHRGTSDGQIEGSAKSTAQPLGTVTTSGAHHALSETTFLVQMAHGNGKCGHKGDKRRVRSTGQPLPSVCGERGDFAKVSAILQQQSGGVARSTDEPVPALATAGAVGKVDYIISIDHQSSGENAGVNSVGDRVSAVTTKARHSLLRPFLVTYYGTGQAVSAETPVPTVTGTDRFGFNRPSLHLVEAGGTTFRRVSYWAWKRLVIREAAKKKRLTRLFIQIEDRVYMVEITHRMLQVHELAAAQGFRPDYVFTGNKTQQVQQIGNAVPRRMARALMAAALTQKPDVSWLNDHPRTVAA